MLQQLSQRLMPGLAAGGALWQVLQHATTAAATTTSASSSTGTSQHGPGGSCWRSWLSTSSAAAQQPDPSPVASELLYQDETPAVSLNIPLTSMEPVCPLTYQLPPGHGTSSTAACGTPLLAVDEVYVDCSSLRTASSGAAGMHAARAGAESSPSTQQGPITAVFLHGLLGSSRNWRSFARKLATEAAAKSNRDVRVLLLDLRCHGDSAARYGFHPPHDLAAAAGDVAAVIRHELQGRAPHLLVGLSLGGKVALALLKQMVEEAQQQQGRQGQQQQQAGPSGLPQQVWVLDSQPGTVPANVDAPTSVGKIIDLINAVPTPLDSRQALYRFLEGKGIPLPVAQWLGTSLAPGGRFGGGGGSNGSSGSNGEQKLSWVFDIQGAAALYNSYRMSSYWELVARPPPGTVVHVVRGQLSDRWTPAMLRQLDDTAEDWQQVAAEAPEAVGQLQLHCLERAGHWLQADNPDGLHSMMLPWFRDMHENHLQW